MKCSKQYMYACNKATKLLGMIKRTIRFKDMRVGLMLCQYKSGGVLENFDLGERFPRPRSQQRGSLCPCARRVAMLGVGAGGGRPLPPRRFTGDLQKMINNMKGKSYEERLYCLKLWTLEERRNR